MWPTVHRSPPASLVARRPLHAAERRPSHEGRGPLRVACRRALGRPTPQHDAQHTTRRSRHTGRGSLSVVRRSLPASRYPSPAVCCPLTAARCPLAQILLPSVLSKSPVASSLWGLTARRYAAAVSGSCDPPHPGCGQHHRLVGHARVDRSFARRCPLLVARSPPPRRSPPSRVAALPAVRRSPPRCSSPLLATRRSSLATRRSPLRCSLNVARWPNSCSSGRRSLLVARCRRSPPAAAVQPPSS